MEAGTEQLGDGRTRVTFPIRPLETRLLTKARDTLEAERDECRKIAEQTNVRYEAAVAEHRREFAFVLAEHEIEPPEGAAVRCDYENSCLIWEVDAEEIPATPDPVDVVAGVTDVGS